MINYGSLIYIDQTLT